MSARAFVFALALAAFALVPAARASETVRTLIVRGRALAVDGTPIAGAHLSARGSVTMATLTDVGGRYSLSIPVGSAAGLRHGEFTLEVRAEQGSRRLPTAAGQSALGVEIAFVAASGHVRVRSNSSDAATAVAAAFAHAGVATAWVVADFGGAGKAAGAVDLHASLEVAPDGDADAVVPAVVLAPGASHAEPPPPALAPRESVHSTPPREAAAPGATVPVTPVRVLAPPPAGTPGPAAGAPPGAALPHPSALEAAPRPAAPGGTLAPASAAGTPPESAFSRVPALVPAPVPATHRPGRRTRARGKAANAKPPAILASSGAGMALAPAAHGGFPGANAAPAAPVPAPDTCACRLRGTVEIAWERPLEQDFPVDLALEGPARQDAEVDMFIGSPREFRFGPLPCGDYRLVVRPQGRIHYTVVRGDSVVRVRCNGITQMRVVLEPHGH